MKRHFLRIPCLMTVLLLVFVVTSVLAQDIREAARKAQADRQTAGEEAERAEQEIMADRERLVAEVQRLEQEQVALEQDEATLQRTIADNGERLAELTEQWSQRELGFREISGNVRIAARDLQSLLKASPLSAGADWRLATVEPLLNEGYFPDIDDIADMAGIFLDEMKRGGQVTRREGVFIGRDGTETTGDIYQLCKFTSLYRTDQETGFLQWSPDGQQLLALSALPSRGVRRALQRYLDGQSDLVTVDFSGGAALRQLTGKSSFIEQVRAGGPIVWPILLIALGALVLVVGKTVYLNRVHGNTDRIMGQVNELAAQGDWPGCEQIVGEHAGKNWPVIHVIRSGLAARSENRETLESVLQEGILRELPRVQQGIALLAVLGAIAPLLGLLGTVTGMIDTFRIITIFGTGDPKLMSGGISEALVTTELGLIVAIPIMLAHTLLSRKADHLIGDMEEKAVQLTNIIQKQGL